MCFLEIANYQYICKPELTLPSQVELLEYVGLEKFHGLKSMDDARQRVQDAVKILTSSGLLLRWPCKRVTEWLPRDNELKSYTGISLIHNKISKLPDYELHLPHLDTFLIYHNNELPMFSDELIKGMKEVRVFDMSWCKDQPLPQSFKFLTKLRMLDLQGNKSLHDISILGEMKELEILMQNWDQLHTMNSSKHVGEANIMEKFFEKLKHLDLNVLDGMEVLWKCPNQYIYGCESLEKWGPGIHETPKLKFVNYDVPLDGPQSIKDAIPKCCYEAE
ncbi:NB-ARC domains-containing protein [Tanacetum coccineum]